MGAPSSLGAPGADAVEVLEREAEGVHHLVAAGAGGVGAMRFHALAHRQRRCRRRRFLSAAERWRAAEGGVPSRFSSIHLPRSTGEVRWLRGHVRMLPWPSRPRRASSVTATRRNWLP